MGKVQATFSNVYPGAISRSVDDVVISQPNTGAAAIAFGAPVFMDTTNGGARGFDTGDGMTGFLGFATRIGIKTPDTYGSSVANYAVGDIMSIMVRGTICVPVAEGTVTKGGKVYLTATGTISATSTNNTQLTNCYFKGVVGADNCAEVVMTERNIQ